MFDQLLIRRIAIGKALGLLFSLIGILIYFDFFRQAGWAFTFGVTLYYIFLGAFVGLAGVITDIPKPRMKYHWWWRGAYICAVANLALVLMFNDPLTAMLAETLDTSSWLANPWMFVIDGAAFGFVVDLVMTKFVGEGRKLLD